MASFKAKFPVLQELFAKNHRGGPLGPPPSGARVKLSTLNSVIDPELRGRKVEDRANATSSA